jgi:hypothetical protein
MVSAVPTLVGGQKMAKITVGTPMWRNGRRNGLKIVKSSISKRRIPFQKTIHLRAKDAIFDDQRHVHDRRVKTSSF